MKDYNQLFPSSSLVIRVVREDLLFGGLQSGLGGALGLDGVWVESCHGEVGLH